jgi:Domain of unknown function (DUF1931)
MSPSSVIMSKEIIPHGRDVIQPFDLPITKGLEESIQAFQQLDDYRAQANSRSAHGASPAQLRSRPRNRSETSSNRRRIECRARARIQDHRALTEESLTEHWQRAFKIFDLLL